MRICVCVKQTPDSASVYVDPISGQIDMERFVHVLNPADACAVEAAVRLKEQFGGEVIALTLGPQDAEAALRVALANGADKALRLWQAGADTWDALMVAAALSTGIQQTVGRTDLIMCGNISSDWGSGIVGPAMAELLDLPQVTGVTKLQAALEDKALKLRLTRRLERGYRELLEAEPPLLITTSVDLNEPRYPSLPAHMTALQATIPVIEPTLDSGWHETAPTTLLEIHTPRPLPRRIAAPNSKHSPFQRIGEIISSGATGRQTHLVEGSPEELAGTLVTFLKEREFI